jgi:splicing factor 3B subunit 5
MAHHLQKMQNQAEHQALKHQGTGHADIARYEWGNNMKRDSLACYVGHNYLLHMFSIATNQSTGRMRHHFLESMLQPVGPPPERSDSDDY